MNKPLAVFISDVHFSLKNLENASTSLSQAVDLANQHFVYLIIAGDLHDTKSLLHAKCISAIIDILLKAKRPPKILIGNHDLLHEKSDKHSLEFLRPYAEIIDTPMVDDDYLDLGFIPYQSDNENFLKALNLFKPGDTLVVHQGFLGASMGEYIKDDSSVRPDLVEDFRVLSGHYHRHQTIGTITYIGTPYTTSFAEANDGPKGIQLLYTDGSLELVPTNLRKHVIVERTVATVLDPIDNLNPDDLLWLKVSGSSLDLDTLNKKDIGYKHLGHQNFKLDKISTDVTSSPVDVSKHTNEELLDLLVDRENVNQDQQLYLKALWRELLK